MALSTAVLLLSLHLLTSFAKIPLQSAMALVLPVVLGAMALVGGVLFVFRLPYSVYYLATSFGLIVLYCFVVQWRVGLTQVLTIAYVPTARCLALPQIAGVNWLALKQPQMKQPCNSVVADFADTQLGKEWERALAQMSLQGIAVYHIVQIKELLTGRTAIHHLHENTFGAFMPSPFYGVFKRLMDIVLVLASVPVVLPICLLTALVIKIQSRQTGGSVLFVQTRIGKGGRPYQMYKFRSMLPTSEAHGAKMASSDDKRITPFGRFIRKTRIDELPQFVNVLKGEMSLIGPRPEQPSFVDAFNDTIPFYPYRHIVRPGISGWAQVMQGYAGNEDETRTKLEYDFYYIKHFSFTLDLLIVIKTVQTMLTGFGAR